MSRKYRRLSIITLLLIITISFASAEDIVNSDDIGNEPVEADDINWDVLSGDYLELAYNQVSGHSDMRGLGITNDPYLEDEDGVETGAILYSFNSAGWGLDDTYHVAFKSREKYNVVDPEGHPNELTEGGDEFQGTSRETVDTGGTNPNDLDDYSFNREPEESPEKSDCDDKYSCNAAVQTTETRYTGNPDTPDFSPRGEILKLTTNNGYFHMCEPDADKTLIEGTEEFGSSDEFYYEAECESGSWDVSTVSLEEKQEDEESEDIKIYWDAEPEEKYGAEIQENLDDFDVRTQNIEYDNEVDEIFYRFRDIDDNDDPIIWDASYEDEDVNVWVNIPDEEEFGFRPDMEIEIVSPEEKELGELETGSLIEGQEISVRAWIEPSNEEDTIVTEDRKFRIVSGRLDYLDPDTINFGGSLLDEDRIEIVDGESETFDIYAGLPDTAEKSIEGYELGVWIDKDSSFDRIDSSECGSKDDHQELQKHCQSSVEISSEDLEKGTLRVYLDSHYLDRPIESGGISTGVIPFPYEEDVDVEMHPEEDIELDDGEKQSFEIYSESQISLDESRIGLIDSSGKITENIECGTEKDELDEHEERCRTTTSISTEDIELESAEIRGFVEGESWSLETDEEVNVKDTGFQISEGDWERYCRTYYSDDPDDLTEDELKECIENYYGEQGFEDGEPKSTEVDSMDSTDLVRSFCRDTEHLSYVEPEAEMESLIGSISDSLLDSISNAIETGVSVFTFSDDETESDEILLIDPESSGTEFEPLVEVKKGEIYNFQSEEHNQDGFKFKFEEKEECEIQINGEPLPSSMGLTQDYNYISESNVENEYGRELSMSLEGEECDSDYSSTITMVDEEELDPEGIEDEETEFGGGNCCRVPGSEDIEDYGCP